MRKSYFLQIFGKFHSLKNGLKINNLFIINKLSYYFDLFILYML